MNKPQDEKPKQNDQALNDNQLNEVNGGIVITDTLSGIKGDPPKKPGEDKITPIEDVFS
jgi:hypothetical protein